MTSFLGGLDLGTPAERNRQTLTRDLELRRERWSEPGYVYRGGADLVLRHGEFFTGRFLPAEYEQYRGEEGQCFANALALAQATGLAYYEGYYNTVGCGVAVNHGWCVDADGLVVDPTCGATAENLAISIDYKTKLPYLSPEHWCYYGVRFEAALVAAHRVLDGWYSGPMLDRPTAELIEHDGDPAEMAVDHDYPILKVPYDPTRTELP